jgi:hypothetical protein
MRDDHQSFIGPMHAYRVEEQVLADRGPTSAAGRTPGVKLVLVSLVGEAGAAAVVPWGFADGVRVVDNRVQEAITPDAPAVERIVEITGPTLAAVLETAGPVPAGTRWYLASEHVQRP